MPYYCPRCGGPVHRGSEDVVPAGLTAAIGQAAFGPMNCQNCGDIPKKEFPGKVQLRMALGSFVIMLVGVGVLIGGLLLLLYILNR